jgi:asparagine synthase (glutamine-hydrolysing)
LPWEYKQHKNERKSILRQAFSSRLPAELFTRPKKGFGLPVSEYLRGAWKYEAAAMLLEGRISRTLVNRNELLQIWKQHLSGQRDWSYLLFNLLVLEIFISNEADS